MTPEVSFANLHSWLRDNEQIAVDDPSDAALHALSREGHQTCLITLAKCRACAVADALTKLVVHARAVCALTPVMELRAQLQKLDRELPQLATRLAAACVFVNRGPIVPEDASDLVRLMALVDEMIGLRPRVHALLGEALPDRELAEPAGRMPPKIVLREAEHCLHRAGFTDTEIAELIDDGNGGTTKQKLDRVGKRRDAHEKDEWWVGTKTYAELTTAADVDE